jgi:signal peptidase I
MLLMAQSTLQNFHIQGRSMEPTLHDQEYMIVNKAAYFFQHPARGDIVVFHNPLNPREDYVKRVIAIPGDAISIAGSSIVINGVPLHETYVSRQNQQNTYPPLLLVVRPDHYFVLGDNRGNSSDSRQWGLVPRENIIGKAVLVYWPVGTDNFGPLPDMSHIFAGADTT